MIWFKKAVLLLIVVLLMASFPAVGIEYRPGEKAAEDLYNHGIGKPWVGGEPPKYSSGNSLWSWQKYPVKITPYSSYEFIGYLNVEGRVSIVSDRGESLQILVGPGSYPLYGYYLGGKLVGLFIDVSGSRSSAQINSYR